MKAIREAAAAAGTSLSEWIRWAAMRAVSDSPVPAPRNEALARARKLIAEVDSELGKLVVGVSGRAAAEAVALQESATALACLGEFQSAASHLVKGRELWTPSHTDPHGDMDRPGARLELARGRLDVAEALATASLRRWEGGRQLSRTQTGTVLATIHVTVGEPGGLQLAHDTITAVRRLHSVRVRRQLLPLADALDTRPAPDAKNWLARPAR